MNANLFSILQHNLPSDAFSKVLVETPGGMGYTYGEMPEFTARLANRLVGLGITPGDRVAVQVDKSPEALMLYLACLRAGAVYLPLNTAYTREEIAYFLGDAEPAVFVCRPADESLTNTLAREHNVTLVTLGSERDGTLLEGLQSESASHDVVPLAPYDLAAILYTSGTTGRSKGAMLTHRNLASNAEVLVKAWRFEPSDRLLHALPIFHTHGLFVACNVTLMAGGSLFFLPRFDVDQVFELLPECTVLMGVPTFYTRMLGDERLDEEVTGNVRLFTSGSAPLKAETHDAFNKRTGQVILERYGMTETNMNTSNPYDGERIAGTVGPPLDGVEVRVRDRETQQILPQGEVGILEVRGENVFSGYLRMPEKTKTEFDEDGFFITGDLSFIDEKGYVHIVGRDKDLVISGGYNVYPKEVEKLINELPEVAESAVIGVPHPDMGESVTAVVETKGSQSVDLERVLEAVKGRLARYKQPRQVFVVDELPRNVMGKVQKNELRNKYANIYGEGY
jgi:malonyl-CoA/methylmalonyl-CoA synthetase